MKRLKLGIGDHIEVFKANMIIPQIAKDIEESNNVSIPPLCPVCNHETSIVENNGVKYLYCLNDYCHAKFIKKLDLFTSRNAMNIDGISEQILSKLFKENMIYDYADIYHLDKYKEEIINFEGFGLKSYENMISSIEKSRHVKIANFVYALGIPEIGFSRAKLICKYYDNDINKIRHATIEELSLIDGVGDVIAQKFVETLNNPDFNSSLDKLLEEVEFIDVKNENTTLKDMVFVITGSLEHFSNRDELIETIENNGGKVISAISSKVTYLINNDVNSTSTKNKKAKELGIKIISENDLMEMLNIQ
jgi:DNA ligase (NAD+)